MAKSEEFRALVEEIKSSKGQHVMDEIERLQASVRLVGRNKVELDRALENLEKDDLIIQLFAQDKRPILNAVIEDIARLLANFLASAFGLVDHARRQRDLLYADSEFDLEIQEQIRCRFANDDNHNIANGLRNYSLHYGILPVATELDITQDRVKARGFKLDINTLLKWDRWTTKERAILTKMGDTIDVKELTSRYFSSVEKFYTWLWGRQFEIHLTDIMATNILLAKARAIQHGLAQHGAAADEAQ